MFLKICNAPLQFHSDGRICTSFIVTDNKKGIKFKPFSK